KPITTNDDLASWWRTLLMGLDYALTRGGPMAVGINQGGIFARVTPESTTPDVQFHVATLSSDMAGSPTHSFSGFTLSVCQLRPQSRGFGRIKSTDPLQPPAIQACYLSHPDDCHSLIAGSRFARHVPVVMIAEKAADIILRDSEDSSALSWRATALTNTWSKGDALLPR